MKRLAIALAVAATLLAATPAQAATRPRPVTVSATSHCAARGWEIDLTVTSTTTRQVDIWVDSDTVPHIAFGADGQPLQAVTVSPTATALVTYAGGMQMYWTGYIYPTGAKFDGPTDPLAQVTQRYPTYADGTRAC